MVDANFKKQNYNMKMRVSEQTIQKLRAGKTFENNIASYKKSGGNAQTLEGMNRFYGKARVSGALGNSLRNTGVGQGKPPTAQHSKTGNTKPGTNPTILKTPKAPKAQGPGFGTSTGNFIKNELLGVDDFSKVRQEMKGHRWGAMAKSIGAGSLELGTTAAAIFGSVFTGGGTLAAEVGAKSAMVAARQVGKAAIKSSIESTVSKTAAKGAISKVATGSLKEGAKTVGRAVIKPVNKNAYKRSMNSAGTAIRKQALKNNVGKQASLSNASNALKASSAAAEKAATSTLASKTAQESAKKVAAKYSSKLTAAGKRTNASQKAGAIRSANNLAKKSIAVSKADRAAALAAKGKSVTANNVVKKELAATAAKVAKRKATNKIIKKSVRRSQGAHVVTGLLSRGYYSDTTKKGKK